MPLIKARTNRVRTVRHICRLQEPNRDALVLYARFIGDTADYVLNQLIETTLAKDREFVAWRAEHAAEAATPRRAARVGAARRGRDATPALSEGLMRALVEHRVVLSLALSARRGRARAARVAVSGATTRPRADPGASAPALYAGFAYTYATLWFTHAVLRVQHRASRCCTSSSRAGTAPRRRQPLPPYPAPEHREDLFLVLGEQHHRDVAGRARRRRVARHSGARPLHRHGSSSAPSARARPRPACIPTSSSSSRIARSDPARKVGGLVLEVKGDFCRHVRDILERHGRGDDYVEVSLDSPYRYNPLHNDLDAYALAYGIATLMTNLFGRGKEPFWQQASTNLVKFVILLHQVARRLRHALPGLRARHQSGQAARHGSRKGSAASAPATGASSSTSASTCSRPR